MGDAREIIARALNLTRDQRRKLRDDPVIFRLLSKASLATNECWEWQASRNGDGYGRIWLDGRLQGSHRVSYAKFCGDIPAGLLVCHHCDNPSCINPSHLFLGHAAVNVKDAVRKGRARGQIDSRQSHFRSGHAPRGEQCPKAILTEPDVLRICSRALAGELTTEIAESFGVSKRAVQDILSNNTWRHVPKPSGLPRPTGRYSRDDVNRRALGRKA